jgi:hypothetical protein
MPHLLLLAGGAAAVYYGLNKVEDTADSLSTFTKWALVAGGGYVAFLGAKKAKLI